MKRKRRGGGLTPKEEKRFFALWHQPDCNFDELREFIRLKRKSWRLAGPGLSDQINQLAGCNVAGRIEAALKELDNGHSLECGQELRELLRFIKPKRK